ncbi:MAG: primosomal protein N' [Acidobacteria bacterium]|nr:primosomal protein N' [Acidobacteriota bacterium]MSO61018.1 primosomal protein N' [Acidobacteriota bacterium]
MTERLVSVAVPVPALGLLTYRVPPDQAMPVPGARVVVPLGPRKLTGVAVGQVSAADLTFKLKDIIQVLDAGAFVPPDVVKLTQWVSDYYLAGPGATLAAALPPHGLTNKVDRFKTVRIVALTAAGMVRLTTSAKATAVEKADATTEHVASGFPVHQSLGEGGSRTALALGAKQKQAMLLLNGAPHGLSAPDLAERGIAAATITRLKGLGYVAIRNDRVDRDPFEHAVGAHKPDGAGRPRALTSEQEAAMAHLAPLAAANAFHVALVHGVTGSGKTEVYLRLADAVRQRGRGVLMLVPEIALTPQVAALFRARFGAAVAIQHSGLSDGERHDQWHRIRRGDVDVVIGTRSAVFAPLANPGLIIVDEEHDTSYKQDETPRYHGRDVAIMRGKFANALVVIGSATPTLESYTNALAGRYSLVTLNRRVLDRPMAQVQVVNMREEIAAAGAEVVLSRALREAITTRLEEGQQSLILLNRRGFATSVLCRQCGASLECPNCSVTLTVHRRRPVHHSATADRDSRDGGDWRARCHYCNFTKLVPKACEKCAAPYMERIGFGTERVEAEIRSAFPSARVARVDRDTVRRKGSLVQILEKVASRDIDVLIGTQMIAKGHDFPECTLVGVISADVGLGLADFRSAERTFQLLTQVAGRAGRGERPGQAIIQSLVPEHYSVRMACDQDYRAFYDKEVEFRRAMRYPPQVAMVNVVVRGKTFADAMDTASDLADSLRGGKGFVVLGPAPAPLTKLRGEHRVQLFLKGTSRKAMREGLQLALSRLTKMSKAIAVDVDPLSML